MIAFGRQLAEGLVPPATIELVGDLGAGKTTLTKGIAQALGVNDEVVSPSFAIMKTYAGRTSRLVHFDFYRLNNDPGLMLEELADSVADPSTITVVEWADTASDTLPINRVKVVINYNDDATRSVEVSE